MWWPSNPEYQTVSITEYPTMTEGKLDRRRGSKRKWE